jgi:hypothetical protein
MKKNIELFILIIACFLLISEKQGNASYISDGLTRHEARNYIGSVLFNIPYDLIETDNVGANCHYNDWSWNPNLFPLGYTGGHGGIDIQTKDVAVQLTADRIFYSLSEGEVIAADQDIYKTIAVYDAINNRTVLYLHARSVFVSVGDQINLGQPLGIQGNNGLGYTDQNTNEHVHLEIQVGMKTGPACGADCSIDPVNIIYEIIVNTPLWDIQDGSVWHYRYVHCLYGLGIISGHPDGSFRPGDPVNRAEFIKMVVLALELTWKICLIPYITNTPPWGIDQNEWYYLYMMKAYMYINYNVSPPERMAFWSTDQPLDLSEGVTRQEAAHIVRNALRFSDNFVNVGISPFTDVSYYGSYGSWVIKIWEKDIIHGYGNHSFGPNNVLNRAEAAKIIRNILKYKGFINYTSSSLYPEICNCD